MTFFIELKIHFFNIIQHSVVFGFLMKSHGLA